MASLVRSLPSCQFLMIDIHSHILPAIDDGPSCLADSVKYVKRASEEGIKVMFATPHAMDGVYQCTPLQILFNCCLLTQELEKHDIPVCIRPGSEVRLTHDTVSQYDTGKLITLNNSGTHILLELPPMFIMDGLLNTIYQLENRGITIIIAHPERNTTIRKNMGIVTDLLSAGVLMQITATSLMGGFGKRIMKTSELLLRDDAVSFVCSDFHPGRKFKMRDAFKKTSRLTDTKTAEKLFRENSEELFFPTPQLINYAY